MMRALAYAKVNLALAVYPPSVDGYHPLSGIFQSVSLHDVVTICGATQDTVTVSNDEGPADTSNLAFVAMDAARRAARITAPASVDIVKHIPSGSGLGGGSADAAAALGLIARRYGIDPDTALEIAASIGSDVPFSYTGGSCLVEGRGERLTPIEPLEGFALVIVVPPFSLSTPDVFRRWDEMGGPSGTPLSDGVLPPVLRGGLPMRNDLYPAAASLDPRIDDWRAELAALWGTEVAMTGSGSALFAFFVGLDEALDAANVVDTPTRAVEAVTPVRHGWEPSDE